MYLEKLGPNSNLKK